MEVLVGKGWTWIPARDLDIYLKNDDQCWKWTQLDDYDKTEVAELLNVRTLIIKAILDVKTLKHANKWFDVYLVYKLRGHTRGLHHVKTSVSFVNDPKEEEEEDDDDDDGKNLVNKAISRNGWKEIDLGDFCKIEKKDQGEVEMKLYDTQHYWKSGLLVKGIELRPK